MIDRVEKDKKLCDFCGEWLFGECEAIQRKGEKTKYYCKNMNCQRDEKGRLGYHHDGILGKVDI